MSTPGKLHRCSLAPFPRTVPTLPLLQHVQGSECQPVCGFGSLRDRHRFSPERAQHRLPVDDARFRRRPPSRVETPSDRRLSLLRRISFLVDLKQPVARMRPPFGVAGSYLVGSTMLGTSSMDGITLSQPPSHRTSQISSASGGTQSLRCLLVRQATPRLVTEVSRSGRT